jgi:O-antigen/teichoic acid export membrane protein
MADVRKSLALSLAARYGAFMIQAVALVVLARLLTPEEVGVYAISAALLALVTVLGDFGVEVYLVQAPRLRRSERQAAVAVTLVTSMAVGSAFILVRGAVADFYGDPRLAPMMLIMGTTLFFVPLNLPMLAMLRRKMMFGALLFVTTTSYLAFAVTAIALAAAGHGPLSMAWATLMQTAVTTALALRYRAAPLCRPGVRAWRRVVVFGMTATSTITIFRLGMTAPELIIGRMLGLEATGLFSRAHGVAQIFNKVVTSAIQPVALPALAAELREGRPLNRVFLRKMEFMGALAWPSYAFVALMADPIVHVVLGRQWTAAVPIIQILCLMGVVIPFSALNAEFFLALGKPQRQLAIESMLFPVKIALVGAASFHSVEAVALALIVARWGSALLSTRYLADEIGYRFREMLHAARKPLVMLAAATAGPALIMLAMPDASQQPVLALMTAAAAAAAGWIAAMFATHHPFEHEARRLLARIAAAVQARWGKRPAHGRGCSPGAKPSG